MALNREKSNTILPPHPAFALDVRYGNRSIDKMILISMTGRRCSPSPSHEAGSESEAARIINRSEMPFFTVQAYTSPIRNPGPRQLVPSPMKPFSDIPPTDPPDFVPDDEPDVPLATPEGDLDQPGDQPLNPADMTTPPERPRGNEPHYELPLRKALD